MKLIMNLLMRGWNLYHKAAMTLVVAIGFGFVLRAFVSWNGGGIESTSGIDIDRPTAVLWPFLMEAENRVRWEAHVIDIVRLSGEPDAEGSTRLVFWKTPRLKRWQSLEGTLEVFPERRLYVQRQSDTADRWLEVTLEPLDSCRTRVRFREQYRPIDYGKRYWAFLESGDLEERLQISAAALKRWAQTTPACETALEQ